MEANNHPESVSHQTIYNWIYRDRPDLKQHLHCLKKYYRSRADGVRRAAREQLASARHISNRPDAVEARKTYGHWEGDTIVGKGRSGYISTLVERKSGYLIARSIPKAEFGAVSFAKAVISSLESMPPFYRRTLALDNGPEMRLPEVIEDAIGIKVYYATPYRSCERAINENTNGLLRYFFPKGTSFAGLDPKDIDAAVMLINNRPRKRLNWKTPAQMPER